MKTSFPPRGLTAATPGKKRISFLRLSSPGFERDVYLPPKELRTGPTAKSSEGGDRDGRSTREVACLSPYSRSVPPLFHRDLTPQAIEVVNTLEPPNSYRLLSTCQL